MRTRLPRTVILLGTISLLTDLSSEMIYPLLPLYLTAVLGASAVSLGIVEGVAESTAALLKVLSGARTDRSGRRKPLVVAGYGLSSAMRPLIGLAATWPTVLGLRFADRVGKGLRTSPRDALISDVTPEGQRGHAYGLHRAMDHAGAVLGPLVAGGLLLLGLSLRPVFLLSVVPGVLVVLVVTFGIREPDGRVQPAGESLPRLRDGWGVLGGNFQRYLLALLLFTLGNSTDAFLLLHLGRQGVPATWIAGLWSLHHVVKMGSTYGCGRLSDRVGRRTLILAGWAVYALVYLGFAHVERTGLLVAIFLVYGLYFGFTEPVERAWVADLVPPERRGTAFGFYHGAIGLTALPASVLFGWLLERFGAATAFQTGAVLALAAGAILLTVRTGSPAAPGPR